MTIQEKLSLIKDNPAISWHEHIHTNDLTIVQEYTDVNVRVMEEFGIDKAVNILKTAGFNKYQIEPVESDAEKDTVVSQSVEKNTEVDINTQIVLEVSKGSVQETTPQITKSITLKLPDGLTDPYTLRIVSDGLVVYETTVQPEQTELSVLLSGTGTEYFDIYINGVYSWPERVDFTA